MSVKIIPPNGVEILDEGVSIGQFTRLDFIGTDVTAVAGSNKVDLSISSLTRGKILALSINFDLP